MDKIEEVLTRGVDEIIVKESLINKLRSGRKLVIKLGIDPTGSQLHLGHAVVLRKMRQFQDLGHKVILIIGDFTAKIGDPSGRTKERKDLSDAQIQQNMESYKRQASKILDMDKTDFVYNSSWLGKLGMQGLFELASKATVAQIMERKEFRDRLKQNIDVPYLEMLYPLMQGYDSVALKADVELGGTDQKFNLLMGRQIQKRYDQVEQDVVTMKLLTGTDGAKMSKSAANFVSLDADPSDMFGKIMAITDELMPQYAELCTDIPLDEFKNTKDPMNLKKKLAKEIVNLYHGAKAAEEAETNFKNTFQQHFSAKAFIVGGTIPQGSHKLVDILINSGITTSTSRAKELVRQGAVEIDDIKIRTEDWSKPVDLIPNQKIKIGKNRIIQVTEK